MSDHPLNTLEKFIQRFVILPNESDYAVVTFWVAHTYFTKYLKTTPRLAVISPEFGCGKSRVLEVLEALSFKGEKLDHFTRSYLMRTVEITREETGRSPTFLLDELDTKWKSKTEEGETIRAFVNSGYRAKGFYGITTGEGRSATPTKFRTFAPIALAGKGEVIPESVTQRGIMIRIQRRSGIEVIEDFLTDLVAEQARELCEWLENWADQNASDIPHLVPSLPALDRDREVWFPLFAMAELADDEWREKALLSFNHFQKIKAGNAITWERQLLQDVMKVFDKQGVNKIRSSVLVQNLCELPESDWSTFGYGGKPLDEKKTARILRTYEITPKQIRFEMGSYKGYNKEEIEPAFKRYCSPAPSETETIETTETKWNWEEF